MKINETILPLVVVCGPTASGKTSLAIDIAEACGGEIICADSRTVYKDIDIGTAKPDDEEQSRVKHWGIDLVEPGEYFSVSDFKKYALDKIDEIRGRGHIPFLVGGTGLYIDSIIFDYKFGGVANNTIRNKLNKMTIEQLHDYCNKNNITLPENKLNKRYVIRSIERNCMPQQRRSEPIEGAIIVGISTDKNLLRDRIRLRAEQLFKNEVIEEAQKAGDKYGWDNEAMKGNIYPLIRLFLDGEISYDTMKERFITLDWRLAKRQMTWLRRNPFIKWGTIAELKIYLLDQLAKYK